MNFKRLCIILGTLILSAALLLTGCKTKTEQKPAEDKKVEEKKEDKADTSSEEVSLNDWEGVWNNYLSYFDDPAMEATLKEVAEKQGKSIEDLKKLKRNHIRRISKLLSSKMAKSCTMITLKIKAEKL